METDNPNKSLQKFLFRILIGSLVYGLLNVASNQLLLPTAPVISLRPQIAVPMFMGIMYGPLAGFITGFAGNILGDLLSGYGIFKFWNWHIANGLIGVVPGLIRYIGIIKIRSVLDFGVMELTVVLASAVGVGFAVVTDMLWIHHMKFPGALHSWILPAFITDTVNGFILLPVLLLIWRRLVITLETRTMLMITSLLVLAVLSTSITITWSIWDDLISRESIVRSFYFAGIVSVIILTLGLAVSALLALRFTKPVVQLTKAATSVEKGDYNLDKLDNVSIRSDELGQLARVLQKMAKEVGGREQELKQQVQELRIEIDRAGQAEEVAKIVETDYFQQLRKKAKEFRKD